MFKHNKVFTIESIMKYPIRNDGKKINKLGLSDDGYACKTYLGLDDEGNEIICNLSSQRIQLFKEKGGVCACCGLKGSFFRAEKNPTDVNYHLNLYGVNKEGIEVLFTKDHIIPKSRGGSNSLRNYNPMCETCNNFKSNDIMNILDLRNAIIKTFTTDERFDSADKNSCLERVLAITTVEEEKTVRYINRMEDL